MNVLIVLHIGSDMSDGSVRSALNLAYNLPGKNVTVLYREGIQIEFKVSNKKSSNVEFKKLKQSPLYNLKRRLSPYIRYLASKFNMFFLYQILHWCELRSLRNLLLSESFEIIHFNQSVEEDFPFLLLAGHYSNAKIVQHYRACPSTKMVSKQHVEAISNLNIYNIFISNYLKRSWEKKFQELRLHFDVSLPNIKSFVMYNLIDFSESHYRFDVNRFSKKPYILYVGRLIRRKAPDLVVEAFSRTRFCNIDGGNLIVVGRGDLESEIKKLAFTLDCVDSVLFIPESSDILQLMANSKAVCLPNFSEPFGRTVAEAIITSAPIVASKTGANIELLSEVSQSWLVEGKDPDLWAGAIDKAVDSDRVVLSPEEISARVESELGIFQRRLGNIYDQVIVD